MQSGLSSDLSKMVWQVLYANALSQHQGSQVLKTGRSDIREDLICNSTLHPHHTIHTIISLYTYTPHATTTQKTNLVKSDSRGDMCAPTGRRNPLSGTTVRYKVNVVGTKIKDGNMKETRDTLPWTSPVIIRVVSVVMEQG